MCPDPALLVAYLDGTLFHRDKDAVDRHLSTCAECASLIENMRGRREAERAARRSRARTRVVAAMIVFSIVGVGLWSIWPRSERAPAPVREAARASIERPRADVPNAPVAAVSTPPKTSAPAPAVPAAAARGRTPRPPATPPAPRVLWRTRDLVVESSADGGMTWVTDYTADRPIRAGAFVDANVAWVVGDNGLILRRTKNGWFGASPPEDANVTAVRATSPSRATVTLEDGRVFATQNGGVTWSLVP